MRRDSIFYKLFQQSPSLLFQLLQNPPANADDYRFDSVAVKEPKFEIDGVFLPPENENRGVVYFCEVQFQKDELGDIRELPIWVALMVLTTVEEGQAPEAARYLLTKTNAEISSPSSRAIIEMITTIMVYKFENLSRTEVESMLGITLKETQVYREIKEEGIEQATINLVVRQLTKRFGELSPEIRTAISALPLPVLEDLSEALLDFTDLADLQVWLTALQD
ncbi:MAG: DUF2887 domain-containing protein [Nostocales cyanobacterium ELA583]|jgi:predicted transposase YdaD